MRKEKSKALPTEKQRSARNKVFTDHKTLLTALNCVHYCQVGGHLWYHSPPVRNGLPDCPFRTNTKEESTIKFFRICQEHYKKRPRRDFDDGDFDL